MAYPSLPPLSDTDQFIPPEDFDGQGPTDENSTPPHAKIASYQIFEATASTLRATRQRILHETAGCYVGPMSIRDFLEDFMPYNQGVPEEYKEIRVTRSRRDAIATLHECAEAEPHSQFVSALRGWAGLRAYDGMATEATPPLRFEDSHKFRDRACLSYNTDVSIYSGVPFVPRAREQVMDFANLHSWVELKPTEVYDAFCDGPEDGSPSDAEQDPSDLLADTDDDEEMEEEKADVVPDLDLDVPLDGNNPKLAREYYYEGEDDPGQQDQSLGGPAEFPFEANNPKGCDTRAQIASYAGATMATQYRNHLFTVVITGRRARFIRWDRAAAIVTRAFDITQDPLLLFEFFKRFRQLTFLQRGSNPDVRPATKHEATLARSLLQGQAPELWLGLAGWLFLKENSVNIETQPFLKLDFEGELFIIPAPHCQERSLSPFGRSSRGTAAVSLNKTNENQSTVCFIKDGWRDIQRTSEHEIYALLGRGNVRNVAKMIVGGDWAVEGDDARPSGIGLGATLGHTYASKSWVRKLGPLRVQKLRRNLVALNVVGLPLTAFRKAHELVGGLADAMQAYEDALKGARVMHGDISPHNILLVKTTSGGVQGVLIDWDHSAVLEPNQDGEPGVLRRGTWQFMSVALLRNPKAKQTPPDDRESAFYVLLWIVLRHLFHDLDDSALRELLMSFDLIVARGASHGVSGGDMKAFRIFPSAKAGINFKDTNTGKVTRLLKDLAVAFSRRYDEILQSTPGGDLSDDDSDDSDDEEEAKRAKARHLHKLKHTVEDPDWLVGKLRKAQNDLRAVADPAVEDWTNNVQDDQVLPPYLSNLVRSRHHYFGTLSNDNVVKRTIALDEKEEDINDLGLEQDSDRQAKRLRLV